jgi:tRNA G46 methylase TrmB
LAEALRIEKEKSRITKNKLLSDAELVIEEGNCILVEADGKMSAAELTLQKEREKMQASVSKEREYVSVREQASELFPL